MSLLPHRYPFLLVDRVLELEPGAAHGRQECQRQRAFLPGHWPGLPIMPGVLIVEAAGSSRRRLDRRQH